MGKIIIAAALRTELKYLRPAYEYKNGIDLVRTGVGKEKAVRSLESLPEKSEIDYILNIGTTGSLSSNLKADDLVLPHTTVDFITGSSCRINKRLRNVFRQELGKTERSVFGGILVTVSKGIHSKKDRENLIHLTGGLAVDMESHFVNVWGKVNEIPVIVLRVVTDRADGNMMEDYKSNLHSSSKRLANVIGELDLFRVRT